MNKCQVDETTKILTDCVNKLQDDSLLPHEKKELVRYANQKISNVMNGNTKLSGKMGTLLSYGRELKEKNLLHNYCTVFIEISNKMYLKLFYGTKKVHAANDKIFEYLTNNMSEDECYGNHFPGAFIGYIRKENLSLLLNTYDKFEYRVENGQEQKINFKIVYYNNQPQDIPEDTIDNVIVGMEKIIEDKNVNILDFSTTYMSHLFEAEKILYMFDDAIKSNEFIPYYQPKVNSNTKKLIGVEALARWKHNDKLIPPKDFITPLEHSGKLCVLDFYMLTKVCIDIRKWLNEGLEPVKVSVNFSRDNFKYNNFAYKILKIVDNYDIPTKYIEIEITETVEAKNVKTVQQFIDTMHQNGIDVSMDDFGSGYSSITALTQLDFDTIKIDKTLVDNMNNRKNYIILSSLYKMFESFGIKVVVEGVETKKDLRMINDIGYENIQGYYYDQPLEIEEFENRLENKSYDNRNCLVLKKN